VRFEAVEGSFLYARMQIKRRHYGVQNSGHDGIVDVVRSLATGGEDVGFFCQLSRIDRIESSMGVVVKAFAFCFYSFFVGARCDV
jgi:hypothetical protein